ncbi:hypothetical protein V6Z12_D01G189600 [Gossypium hirsutum]
MLGEDEKDRHARAGVAARKPYLRSVSWTDRSPIKPHPRPPQNTKGRSCLPPLSITRRPVEEWPKAGSDDLGVWPNPQTPRGSVKPLESPGSNREFQLRRDKLAFFDKECSRIAEHIYLGSDAVAKNRELLRKNGITHVLNCVGFVCPEYFKHDLVYKTLWLQDSPSEDITSILYDVFDYFEDVQEQGGKVLVHCCQGVSRSSSLVIAYLMWREGQSFEDAFQYVKAARGVTNPNTGFAFQLLQCQKRVHAVPASPNSVLRMYRMAPHSSYDALHLVPKMVNYPAANQVIRYEQAKGPILTVREGDEPLEFWDALASGQISADGCDRAEVRKQPSPSGLEATDLSPIKNNVSSMENSCLPYKESFPSSTKSFSSDCILRVENPCMPCKGTPPSLAERRGSHPPPRMWLPSADAQVPGTLVRSRSFSLPNLEDDVMNDIDCNRYEPEDGGKELMLDVEAVPSIESHSRSEDKREYGECQAQSSGIFKTPTRVTTPALYQWPTLNKVEMHRSDILEPAAVYVLLASERSLGASDHSTVLYIWLGRDACEKGQSQFLSCDDTHGNSHHHWESIGHDFLNKMDLPLNASIQIVREGEEPEQFLNLFNCYMVLEG